jgi:ribonuclease D
VVHDAESAPEVTLPPAPPPEVADRVEVLGSLGQLIVSTRAAASQLASQLVATRGEIESFMTNVVLDREPAGPLSTGWRRTLAGDALIALAEGRLALRPTSTPPYVEELPL